MAVNVIFIPTIPKHKNLEVTIWCASYQYNNQTVTQLHWVWDLIMVGWKQMVGEEVEMATLSRRHQWWRSGAGKLLADLLGRCLWYLCYIHLVYLWFQLQPRWTVPCKSRLSLHFTRPHLKHTPLCILLQGLFWHLGNSISPCTSTAQKYWRNTLTIRGEI